MTTDTITSVTLDINLIHRLIQNYLNEDVLIRQHVVTALDIVSETDTVVVALALPETVVTTTDPTVWTYPQTATPTLPTNGNGHHANLEHATSEPVQPTPEVAPEEQPKSRGRRLSLVERERVRDLLGEKTLAPQQIANQLGCHVSTVYTIKKRIEADAPAVTADGAA